MQYFSAFLLRFTFLLSFANKRKRQKKLACAQNVPDECNLITIICLSCWGVDCASTDKSKLEWKLHFLEWKSRSLGVKNYNIRTSISVFYHHFFLLSFDWNLSCKLQLIDLITVFAAFLVGRQTILVSFFSWERRNRKETNGWKNKSATGRYRYTSHVLSVKSLAQYLTL